MKKLVVSVFAFAMMTTGAMAGEVLTTSQLDQVKAGFFDVQIVKLRQKAEAEAASAALCGVCGLNASSATAIAANVAVISND